MSSHGMTNDGGGRAVGPSLTGRDGGCMGRDGGCMGRDGARPSNTGRDGGCMGRDGARPSNTGRDGGCMGRDGARPSNATLNPMKDVRCVRLGDMVERIVDSPALTDGYPVLSITAGTGFVSQEEKFTCLLSPAEPLHARLGTTQANPGQDCPSGRRSAIGTAMNPIRLCADGPAFWTRSA